MKKRQTAIEEAYAARVRRARVSRSRARTPSPCPASGRPLAHIPDP